MVHASGSGSYLHCLWIHDSACSAKAALIRKRRNHLRYQPSHNCRSGMAADGRSPGYLRYNRRGSHYYWNHPAEHSSARVQNSGGFQKESVTADGTEIKNTATRRTRGCSYVGKTHIPRRHVQRVSGLALAFYFFLFPSLSVSGMLICSPSLSSDSCCRMYSAIRLVFFPVVST